MEQQLCINANCHHHPCQWCGADTIIGPITRDARHMKDGSLADANCKRKGLYADIKPS